MRPATEGSVLPALATCLQWTAHAICLQLTLQPGTDTPAAMRETFQFVADIVKCVIHAKAQENQDIAAILPHTYHSRGHA